MLRKLGMLAVAAAIAGMVIGGASFASADGEQHATVLTLKSRTVSQTEVNVGPKGPGPGDMFLLAALGLPAAALATDYTDAQGDSGAAPDYLGLTITNDNDGNLTLDTDVDFNSRTNFAPNDLYIVHLDTDQDPNTGGLDGAEYEIVANLANNGSVASEARKWNPAANNWDHLDTPLVIGYGDGPFFTIVMADFGLAFGDSFDTVIRAGVVGTGVQDVAPDANSPTPAPWSYTIEHVSICGLDGTDGPDVLLGTSMPDYICGFAGNDDISGLGDNDRLVGGGGRDRIAGGIGDDDISGGRGKDRIKGGFGDDLIKGGRKRDIIRAGGGNDEVRAGRSNDKVYAQDGEADLINCGRGTADRLVSWDPGVDVLRSCELRGTP
jgi:Ca2+-binding RTX toxin-like protein